MSKLDEIRKRYAPSSIPLPGANASWHEDQSYGERAINEHNKKIAAALDDVKYLLAELDAAHELIEFMWRKEQDWTGAQASSHVRSDVFARVHGCLAGLGAVIAEGMGDAGA